ncbi:MAG: hypothetical protein M1834_005229 [Cirrosporium novae-zelandiae]|nr:MAG: hypothetical protein M1834_005229 [Cirrosporium novae-zelandiae]
MTGGPGCSGMIGMLLELGPCLVNEHGNSTHANPYGWTRNSSMIFIDQPAGTGFSYTDPGVGLPGDSFVSASDMYIFLQIFLTQVFPEKRSLPFHISGESYGGHYVPALSAEILQQNELHFHRPKIPLKSIFVGDGFFSPLDTTWGYYETLCTTKPGIREPVFNETRCQIIAETLPRCAYVHEACYKYPDEILCKAADQVCQEIRRLFYDESHAGGRDPFDITRTCEVDGVCYSGAIMVQEYMNLPWVQKALDVPGFISNFSICSDSTVAAFDIGNDLYVNTMDQVKYTLEHGADVLIYNGNLDLACNTAGNLRWTNSLSWNGQAPFAAQDLKPWFSTVEGVTIPAGTYKEVYAFTRPDHTKKQRFSFVTIDNSGHMVPLDQPEIALDMVQKWLSGRDF